MFFASPNRILSTQTGGCYVNETGLSFYLRLVWFQGGFFYTGNKEVSNIVLSIFLSANFRTIHVIVVRIYNICPHWPPKQLHQNYDMDRMEPLLPRTKGNTVTTMIITFLQRVPLSRRPTPLKNTKIWKSVGIIIPNSGKIKAMFQTTNQIKSHCSPGRM